MGCATSKDDDSPAVVLCRERCAFLDEAVRLRFTFAEAHAAYLLSLKTVGSSLDTFFNQDLEGLGHSSRSPALNLPPHRKGDPHPNKSSDPSPDDARHLHSHSNSNSGSHLHFHSDSESDDNPATEALHQRWVSSPVHRQNPYDGYMPDYGNLKFPGASAGGEGFLNISYMKNQAAPSILHTQRPMSLETMYIGESSASTSTSTSNLSYYPFPGYFDDGNNKSKSNPPYSNYNSYPNYPNYSAGVGYFDGSSATPVMHGGEFPPAQVMASSSKAPPPPPSPPRSSGWDFLDSFASFEKYYLASTPGRDLRERQDSGIPDLEDEDADEVMKYADSRRSSHSKPGTVDDDKRVDHDAQRLHKSRPILGVESDPVEYEVHVVEKAADSQDRSKDQANVSGFKPRGGFKGDLDIVREIQIQFDRASESGTELAKFLEVGKLPYKRKNGVHQVSSKILHLPLMSSSQPSTASGSEVDSADSSYLNSDQDVDMSSKNLSSTLHKLFLWEKKLYQEVKIEEKSRFLHERKSGKLKHLDRRGAESNKIDTTRTLVRNLSTKIRIAIQVVDKISVKINCLRDEELWPLLNDFIQGLAAMWKRMLECHRNQCQAIREAKRLDAIALSKHVGEAHFEATRQLEHDLIDWTLRFSYWVDAQKGYVRALNNWLMKCLLYVPEETADGTVPFSPSRIGAPPVFIVCHQWGKSIERISEKEVIDSMRELASNVFHLWDRDKEEMRQRMLANKDEWKIKNLDREDQKIQKEILALDKRMAALGSVDGNGNVVPLTGHAVFQGETAKGGSLQARLRHVLEAMEKFTAGSLKVYEELLQRIQEDNLTTRDHERVS